MTIEIVEAPPLTGEIVEAPPLTGEIDEARGRFIGQAGPFFRLVLRGSLLLLVTLGIYRFWLATDIRRFLWVHSEIAGDGLEYTGTGRELLLGFLLAVVVLIPVNAAVFIAAFDVGAVGRLSGIVAFVFLAYLGHFALFRARRYRLTRTVYRGLRFHQDGSALRYALRAVLWWSVSVLTLGLAYPFGQASLERYKMRHTHYGDLPGRFEGSGLRLFLRGLPLWLLVMGPSVAGLYAMATMIDWPAVMTALSGSGSEAWADIEGASPGIGIALSIGGGAVVWALVAAALLYPAFQAVVLRWWISGLRFGPLAARASVPIGSVYRVYLRFLGYALLLALIAGVVAVAATLAFTRIDFGGELSPLVEVTATGLLVAGYAIVALAYSAIYQATVKLGLWRLGFERLEVTGVVALERVGARGAAVSAFGEGLVDALGSGGV